MNINASSASEIDTFKSKDFKVEHTEVIVNPYSDNSKNRGLLQSNIQTGDKNAMPH